MGNTITLETIGGGQPDQMILPAGTTYPAANASITNGMFSPYVYGPATFTLALSGVTAATTITGAPGPLAGAGMPGLIAACAGLLALARRRRQKIA